MIAQIEAIAEGIRAAYTNGSIPVNPVGIAEENGIVTAPGSEYGPGFDACVAYYPGPRVFLLYYRVDSRGRLSPRDRFSVAHELGHLFIPGHRRLLIAASYSPIPVDKILISELERQANEFAGALLIPADRICRAKAAGSRDLVLPGILDVASECETSLQCAAARYASLSKCPCALVITDKGKPTFQVESDAAGELKYSRVARIPRRVAEWRASVRAGASDLRQSFSKAWFVSDRRFSVREENIALSASGYVLTVVSWDA